MVVEREKDGEDDEDVIYKRHTLSLPLLVPRVVRACVRACMHTCLSVVGP